MDTMSACMRPRASSIWPGWLQKTIGKTKNIREMNQAPGLFRTENPERTLQRPPETVPGLFFTSGFAVILVVPAFFAFITPLEETIKITVKKNEKVGSGNYIVENREK